MNEKTFHCSGYVTWKSDLDDSYLSIIVKRLPLTRANIELAGPQGALYRVLQHRRPANLAEILEDYVYEQDSTAWKKFEVKPYAEEHDWARTLALLKSREASVHIGSDDRIVVYGEYQWRLGQGVYVVDIAFAEPHVP